MFFIYFILNFDYLVNGFPPPSDYRDICIVFTWLATNEISTMQYIEIRLIKQIRNNIKLKSLSFWYLNKQYMMWIQIEQGRRTPRKRSTATCLMKIICNIFFTINSISRVPIWTPFLMLEQLRIKIIILFLIYLIEGKKKSYLVMYSFENN